MIAKARYSCFDQYLKQFYNCLLYNIYHDVHPLVPCSMRHFRANISQYSFIAFMGGYD